VRFGVRPDSYTHTAGELPPQIKETICLNCGEKEGKRREGQEGEGHSRRCAILRVSAATNGYLQRWQLDGRPVSGVQLVKGIIAGC
jgi:hypothetical protein